MVEPTIRQRRLAERAGLLIWANTVAGLMCVAVFVIAVASVGFHWWLLVWLTSAVWIGWLVPAEVRRSARKVEEFESEGRARS